MPTPPEWTADFDVYIGDEGLLCNILADVTRDDEIDPESICATVTVAITAPHADGYTVSLDKSIDLTPILNEGHRKQILAYFERKYFEIKEQSTGVTP